MCLIADKCIFIFQARLAWAQQMMQCHNIAYWRRVHWSDECRFVLYKSDGRVRVWQRRGEQFHPDCIQSRAAFGGGSVMVWGMVSLNCKSDLVTINGNLNARRYRAEILAKQVEPHFDDHALADRPIFMHDGAKPHTARISMALLRKSAMEVLPWPSLNPDLNPIEHVWDYIRQHLNEMDPRVQSLDELRKAIHEVWRHIPQQYVRRLIHSMRRRVAAVIAADGGSTHYWLL